MRRARVWAVLDGAGTLHVQRQAAERQPRRRTAAREHERHTAGELELEPGPGVDVQATCFTPGLA